jgi:hypothetical protein
VSGILESGKLSQICGLMSLTNCGAKCHGYFIYTMEEFTSLLTINSVGLLRDFIGVVAYTNYRL